jgi:RNA polymerase sigma-70 factor (ECF subfamily)
LVIKNPLAGHLQVSPMPAREIDPPGLCAGTAPAHARSPELERRWRLRSLVDLHYDFVWRTVRHLGVPESSVEDGTQQVLCVLARRLDDVAPGAELSFLFATAVRVAKDMRRSERRHPATPDADIEAYVAADPSPDDLLARRRARAELQQILESLPEDVRIVFVLYEIEELTMAEIAHVLGIPAGTAASRLRRGRKAFEQQVARRRAQGRGENGGGRE